jgi:hypothetical protein
LTVGEDTPGDSVQPEDRLLAWRGIIDPPPEDEERLGDDIVGIASVSTST